MTLSLRKYKDDIQVRKHRLHALRTHPLTEEELKTNILQIRNLTLSLIEDGIELEYLLNKNKNPKKTRSKRLLPILQFNSQALTNNEINISYVFTDLITDNEDLFRIPYIQSILAPMGLPAHRNPFFLSKTIDELSELSFRIDDGLGIDTMEILRYKRCADALLKAELQSLNKVPLTLADLHFIWKLMKTSNEVDVLIRCIYTILMNETAPAFTEQSLVYLSDIAFAISPEVFLQQLNAFKGTHPMLINVLAAVRQTFSQCQLDSYKEEPCLQFLIHWLETVLQVNSSMVIASPRTESKTKEEKPKPQKEVSRSIESQKEPTVGDQGLRMSKLKAEIDRSVKQHMDKYLKERKGKTNTVNSDDTESLRYELIKLQQELLKRKVLNPLHYKLVSVDSSLSDQKLSEKKQRTTSRLSAIYTQSLKWEEGHEGQLEVCLDGDTDALVLRLMRVHGDSGREVVAFIRVDKLEYNRLTGTTFEEFLSYTLKNRIQHLLPILNKVVELIEKTPNVEGQLFLDMDRTIYSNSVIMNGVTLHISMSRDQQSASILIHCTPRQNSSSHGVITLVVSDKELLILLINQKSLFNLALTKWSSMEAVGEWLASRLTVAKLPLIEATTSDNYGKKTGNSEALQISVNRSVEIPEALIEEWRRRNSPLIPGIAVALSATQFEETLRINLMITCIESRSVYEAQEMHDMQLLPSRSSREVNFANDLEIPKYHGMFEWRPIPQ